MAIEPYLFFNGRCEEAVEFYKKALGAEVLMMMRFKESPEPHPPGMLPPGSESKIMHACIRIGDASVMASDGRCTGQTDFQGFSLSLAVANEAEAEREICGSGGWWTGANAAGQNLLVALLRHGRRPLWRRLDGQRGALTFFRRQR